MDHITRQPTHRVSFVKGRNQKVRLLNRQQRLENFDANKQTWKLFLDQMRGMAITCLFLGCFVTTMTIYERIRTADSRGRLAFNTLSTAIILGLGLNFFEVFKDMAKVMRWRILSSGEFEVRQIDLILGSESLLKVLELILENLSEPLILVVSVAWLVLNFIAQVSVAILPLFAQLESGFNSDGITLVPGTVTVPKLDCFYRAGSERCLNRDRYDPAIAHTYGAAGIVRGQDCGYDTAEDLVLGRQTCPYFYRRNDRREFAYRYADSNPDDSAHAYPYLGAGRIVTASASNCNAYKVPKAPSRGRATTNDSDGTNNVFIWPFVNATANTTIEVPRSACAQSSTTYIWNDKVLPRYTRAQACGPRCVFMYALRDMIRPQGRQELFMFQCQVTVSPVSGITHPAHRLSDDVARTAAASIALTGRWRVPRKGEVDWRQYQLYQEGANWAANLDDTPEDVGARMAEFAIAALGVMARRNPIVKIPGRRPTLGYQVKIDWQRVIVISVCIVVTHALLVALMLRLARPVVVGDDSYLVVARLLRSLVAPLSEGHEEDLLDGKKIAREIAASVGAQPLADEGEELRPWLGGGVDERPAAAKEADGE